MNFRDVLIGTVTAFLATGAFVGGAHATAYTSEALWRADAGLFALETFDTTAAGSDVNSLPALGIKFDPLNDGTQPTVQPYSLTGGITRSSPNDLLNDSDFDVPGRGPITVRPILDTDFIFALGLWNVGADDQLRLSFYDGTDTLLETVISDSGIGFFGIINTTGAKRAVVDFVGGNGFAPTDDWQTATRETFDPQEPNPGQDQEPNSVPEPATLALLAVGLLGLCALRRRHGI